MLPFQGFITDYLRSKRFTRIKISDKSWNIQIKNDVEAEEDGLSMKAFQDA